MLVVFSCIFSASHEFFIHTDREREIEAKRGDDGGHEMAVYSAFACVDLPWCLRVNFSLSPSLSHCEFYVEFNLSYWANMPTKIADVIEVSSFLVWPSLQTNSNLLTSVA